MSEFTWTNLQIFDLKMTVMFGRAFFDVVTRLCAAHEMKKGVRGGRKKKFHFFVLKS